MQTTRYYIKHRALASVFAVEADEEGTILAALDLTDEAAKGGLCPHLLTSLPLTGQVDDVRLLTRDRDDFAEYFPDCGNVHHLLADLLMFERDHRAAASAYALADSRAKSLKQDVTLKAARVHELLERISDRQPLPLFAASGIE